ncbi:unnamed protein product [Hydatigera taeniaeformis]|uniref:Conserved oligomeric Golgi complex subunit 1 n=1 Tax=Hydatigena taeniaeformis TaxID=6205 RepID=A0A0R3WRE7_HYDTA|nr:unnamed protein product [Hydatigera taeniaeformis]
MALKLSCRFFPWTDVSKLRQAWLSTSRSLRSLASHLSLTAILRITAESSNLENLYQLLSFIHNGSCSSDAKVVATTSRWCEITLKPPLQDIDSSAAVVTLKVPSHPSWPLQETLFTLVRNLTTLSVHTLPRGSAAEAFGKRLAESLLNTYRRLVGDQEGKLTQPQALQLLFDVRFILRLLVWPLASTEKRPSSVDSFNVGNVTGIGQDLLKCLETAVDPFDLEMCSECLNAGIGFAVRATSALYAMLIPVSFGIAFEEETGGSRDDFSNLGFLSLIPSLKGFDGGVTKKAVKMPVFGLLPFSLSQVRPPLHVTPTARKRQPTLEKSKVVSSAARGSSDFLWFGGLSFT